MEVLVRKYPLTDDLFEPLILARLEELQRAEYARILRPMTDL